MAKANRKTKRPSVIWHRWLSEHTYPTLRRRPIFKIRWCGKNLKVLKSWKALACRSSVEVLDLSPCLAYSQSYLAVMVGINDETLR